MRNKNTNNTETIIVLKINRINRTHCSQALVSFALLYAAESHAQSNVSLYGVLDAGLLYASHYPNAHGANAGPLYAFNDSGVSASSFGMQGVEDLGGGMKLKFKLESGVSTGTGALANSNKNEFGRQAYLALENGYGTVAAGLQYSPFLLSVISTDPRGNSYFFGSSETLYVDNVAVTGMFNSNAITYTSPKVGGFSGSAMMALGGEAGDFAAGRQYALRLSYDAAFVHLDAAMYNGDSGGTAASTPVPSTVAFAGRTVGAKFYLGSLALGVAYSLYKVAGGFSSQVYGTGLSYDVNSFWNLNAGTWYTRNGNNSADHSILAAVGTSYSLSKRTALYAQVGFVNNHGKMTTGFIAGPALPHEVAGSTTAVSIGIRHRF
ncbi:porin [Paraburkholderia silviterrae]|uniref:Porin n=1 Tax=Paraburkholderia silviterrae TaxID=2528715 RepID=A0A4R5M1D5_9BURK|nr:porin [Paraburkholderia silviterrae]